MKRKFFAYLVTLPRWFGLPAAVCAVLLGVALGGHWGWLTAMVTLSAIFQMAYAHTFNALLDYSWTGLDRGAKEERSQGKPYTFGQQVIADGILTPREVFAAGLAYLAISAGFAAVVSWKVSPIIWAIWVPLALCTFLYSYGKLHYFCEAALGLGFGPLAVMLGASAAHHPDFKDAFLAGLPFALLFGYAAEIADQWLDAEPNIPKGLKNIGALLYRKDPRDRYLAPVLGLFFSLAYICQLGLVLSHVLEAETCLSLWALPFFVLCLSTISHDLGVTQCTARSSLGKVGIFMGLGGIFIFMTLLLVGQIVGG
ncbi:MAG: prenyltransferase [Dehalococcoidales bacterium]|nr:prenyltransferase [Dehalococcoidales bacterium]